jgi:murein lipoprotein
MKRILIAGVVVGACAMSGCATNSDVRIVREQVEEADRKADEALSEAREAKRLAQEANERSMRSEEMLNRSFKRSMYK